MTLLQNICFSKFFLSVFFCIFLLWMNIPERSAQTTRDVEIEKVIDEWAIQFGSELWDLAQNMTKSPEIKAKYKTYNARVERKDGTALIQSIVENVGRMLLRKMDAIKCILNVAEEMSEQSEFNDSLAENYTYYSSKYSPIHGRKDPPELPEVMEDDRWMYQEMFLDQDTHFYNISVNTSHSSVHVPTNVYDKHPMVMSALQWSEALDNVFVNNYNSDPALSWQYFGSDTGILRHYPAMEWEPEKSETKKVDTYDCRTRSWYIETATCSKDVVILLDNSGSMTGYRNYIAQLTVKSVLDTFSNNDFLTIFNYSNTVDDLVPCFKDTLIQATQENKEVFNDAVSNLAPEGYADVKKAFVKAFQLLEKYRAIRKCNESTTGCNQAIMLITDGVAGNITDIFEKYNWYENGTKIPVRIFTYLLGKEVTKVREIQWMACLNRGYYSHVQSLDQVQGEVLKYVTIIANPLVLQAVEHPPTWTHAFADKAFEQEDNDKPPRLMIAVGAPAFDRRNDNNTKTARLLGVAGTDVPVEDINKLTLPYKLGVNGYSFIVSNNGYVLLHPDLRPVFKGVLKENYNSIDLTEVEQFDDNRTVRDPGPVLIELRDQLVNSEFGTRQRIPVLFHYDQMRRISQEYQDYYFAPLPNTPFSLGLVLPSEYGNTWIKVGDEIRRNQHMGLNISEYFVGENWKVHPEWVYCKYHYLEGHEFKTPEDELIHFLKKLAEPNWKWSQQYEPEPELESSRKDEPNCGRKTLDDDAYYCNKELVQLLVFDAKVTNNSFRNWQFASEQERDIIERYNATLRFVATMSGLTRWQFIFGEVEVDTDREFGDYHTTAIDETWYKSAILQHKKEAESFVYSVPNEADPPEEGELKVTASMAIFPRDGGFEAPGCVVGFQFSHQMMYNRFLEITEGDPDSLYGLGCETGIWNCYVIDNNGYILLSSESNFTGKFFGEVEGDIMGLMVEGGIYNELTVFDLQGLCFKEVMISSDSELLMTPFKLMILGFKWMIAEIFFWMSRIQLWINGDPLNVDYFEDYDDKFDKPTATRKLRKGQNEEEEAYFNRVITPVWENQSYACDKKSNLYVLEHDEYDPYFQENSETDCIKQHHFKKIPHSNLLLVVVRALDTEQCRVMSASPQIIEYEEEFPCHKLSLNFLTRRRLEECFTEHPDEEEVAYCGRGAHLELSLFTIATAFILYLLVNPQCAQKYL